MSYGWAPYVPVAERRRKAAKEIAKSATKGKVLKPVCIQGRTIARSFWGKAWCEHLESFSDYENRLPRGRTYVRNGSVCHLEISRGHVEAKVSGSHMYTVSIDIKPLKDKTWDDIRKRCTGKIESLLDLLGGRLSDGVMAVVTDREKGLFPKPREISLDCSCPDYATMCKHVAAVLYGVGARLDESPELLFLLRGVNHEELVSAGVEEAVREVIKGGKSRRIADADLSEVFGVDLDADEGVDAQPLPAPRRPKAARPLPAPKRPRAERPLPAPKRPRAERPAARIPARPLPDEVTGGMVRDLRTALGLSGKDFALRLGVSAGIVSAWERNPGVLKLQRRSREALERVQRS